METTSILTTATKILPAKLLIPIAVILFSLGLCRKSIHTAHHPPATPTGQTDSTYVQKLIAPIINPPKPLKQ